MMLLYSSGVSKPSTPGKCPCSSEAHFLRSCRDLAKAATLGPSMELPRLNRPHHPPTHTYISVCVHARSCIRRRESKFLFSYDILALKNECSAAANFSPPLPLFFASVQVCQGPWMSQPHLSLSPDGQIEGNPLSFLVPRRFM